MKYVHYAYAIMSCRVRLAFICGGSAGLREGPVARAVGDGGRPRP